MIRLSVPENSSDSDDKRAYLKQGLAHDWRTVHLETRTRQLAHKLRTPSIQSYSRIKSQKTVDGEVAATKRNINLNWHLILLEEALIDYVIIHELMHLKRNEPQPSNSGIGWSIIIQITKQAEKAIRQKEWMIGILD